jgi:hypothetical protein
MKEELRTNFELFTYRNVGQALAVLKALDRDVRLAMAVVYRDAFGGKPWYERYACTACGEYSKENRACLKCGGSEFSEAYPVEWLINEYFPKMVTTFVPGLLILARQENQLEGFSTGGGISMGQLIANKYGGDPTISRSILAQTGLTDDSFVFYDNETCISPSIQSKGIGSQLNQERIVEAVQEGFNLICGRSINQPWLNRKRLQFEAQGYDFKMFVPAGDKYVVEGQQRYFYLAFKRKEYGENNIAR